MSENPIQGITGSIMDNLRQMVDANTIIGEAIVTPSGVTIIPISKISVGFGLGGSDFKLKTTEINGPFGGGGMGGLSIIPVAFLTISGENVKLITIDNDASTVDKAIAMIPDLLDKAIASLKKRDKEDEADYL